MALPELDAFIGWETGQDTGTYGGGGSGISISSTTVKDGG